MGAWMWPASGGVPVLRCRNLESADWLNCHLRQGGIAILKGKSREGFR